MKNPRIFLIIRLIRGFFRTQSRDRTGTGVNLLVFETSASTNSAIWAFSMKTALLKAVQRYVFLMICQRGIYYLFIIDFQNNNQA